MVWRQWSPYVPVALRRVNALREMGNLRKKGKDIQPVVIEGRTIARSFWGRGWCDHLESYSDFENRLPRGRTYVRNGSVCHLAIQPGRIEALVSGSELYHISILIKKLKPATWKSVRKKCSGRIGSMLELLQGRLSDQVMTVVTDRKQGLFPQPNEIQLSCDCPDWAVMCKHVAAVLYGVGSRLDSRPELLFLLRGVDAQALIATEMAMPRTGATVDRLDDDQLGDIFGIDLDRANEKQPAPNARPRKQQRDAERAAAARRKRKRPVSTRLPVAVRKRISARHQSTVSHGTKRKIAVQKKRRGTITSGPAPVRNFARAAPKIRPTGKSVARLRKRLGLSVVKFALRLDVSPASVYRWEATTGRLSLQTQPLTALAECNRSVATAL